MINKKYLTGIILAGTIAGFTGCGEQKVQIPASFNTGNSFFQKQDYKKAVEYYEMALKKAPMNKMISDKLAEAKRLYVKSETSDISSKLTTTKNHSIQNLTNFKNRLNSLTPHTNKTNSQKVTDLRNMVEKEIARTKKTIEKIKSEIDELVFTNKLEPAPEKLNLLAQYDSEVKNTKYYKDVLQKVDQYYVDHITDLLLSNQPDLATKKFLIYKKYNLNPDNIALVEGKIKKCRKINKLIDDGYKFINSFRINEALANVKELRTIEHENVSLKKKAQKLEKTLVRKLLSLAKESLDENQIFDAYFYILKASKVKSSVKFTTVGKALLDELYSKAKEYTSLGLDGNAYALYLYIQTIDPSYKSTFVLHRDAKDKLIKRNILKVAVSEFVTPNLDRSSGSRFSASLTSQLFKETKKELKDINVIERNRLKAILDELKLRETGNLESLAQRGKIKGINIFVFGDIIESSVEPQRRESTEQTMVKIGTRKVNNNQFMLYMMASAEDKKKWRKIPNEFIEEDVNQLVSYKKGEIKKTANLIVSVRIVNIEKGEIVAAETIESQKIVADKYNDGVPLAGIQGNVEEIVSDKTLIKELHKDMINKISQFVLNPFTKREKDKISQSESQIDRREYNKAMESLVDSMMISELKKQKIDPSIEKKKTELFKEIVR